MLTTAPSAAPVPVPVCSRRIGAGIHPDPGATSRLPAWWSATDWVEGEVRGAVEEHRDLCQAHHVDPDTVLAVARGMATFADFRTGRDCRPTNTRLVALLRCSLSTVQRARRVLKQLGLVVELIRGRSIMTRAERLTAWERGSSHRQVAAEFALCSRRRRPQRRPAVVERDTPTQASFRNSFSYEIIYFSSTHRRDEEGRSAPRCYPERAPARPATTPGRHPTARRSHPNPAALAGGRADPATRPPPTPVCRRRLDPPRRRTRPHRRPGHPRLATTPTDPPPGRLPGHPAPPTGPRRPPRGAGGVDGRT
jgi:hypothetical protein